MIICSSSNIDLIQGVSGYGTVSDGATDWRIENTATGVFNILNSPNLLTPNVSIIDAGNIGIGTIPVSGTNKLQVQGNLNVSGGYFVAGVAFKPATAVLADTATALATSRNIAGVGFNGTGAIDIPYFNLTNKITAGNGISLTSGSASSSPSISTNLTAGNGITISAAASPTISTNLTAGNGISISAAASPVITANITAGTNITFTGTNPISISSAGGSKWSGTGNIYYNTGNVGIGTATIQSSYKLQVEGNAWVENQLVFGTTYKNGGGADFACNKIVLYGAGNTPTTTGNNGFGVEVNGVEYFSGVNHTFYTGTTGGTGYGTERMRITSTGNVLINKPNSAGVRLEVITTYDDVNSSLRIDAAGGNDHYSLNIWAFVQGGGMVGWRFRVKSVVGGDNTAIQIANTGSVYFPIGSSSASDSRIKKDIEDINDATALNKLLLIQPTTYNYIDVERNKGFGKVYGFIAQQIREVIPEAITIIVKEVIPNIYKRCLINNKREVYHSIPLDTPIDTSVKIDDTQYKIKEIYEDYFVIDKDIYVDEAFVFGYSVDDFHTLNKDYIFTLNVCATQELHRRIEAQSVLLKSQDDRIKDLESKVATLMSM